MHRGGTSAVTGVLHQLGAFLGPADHLMVPRDDNPVGFFEHQLLTDLNDELLHALGGSWHQPPALDPGWERAPHLDGIRSRAEQRLHADFADARLWAWKDPRTSLTLPFWRPLLPHAQFVVCVRNPLDVARSLRARDGLDEVLGIDLWMRHTVSALAGLATTPLLVLYDELVNHAATEVTRIAEFLELDAAPKAVARARAHLGDNAGLRHHLTPFAESCAAPAMSFAAMALYAVLQRSVALQRAGALQFEDLLDVTGPLAGRAAMANAVERDAANWPSQRAALDARAAELVGALELRDADLDRARADVAALTGRLHESTAAFVRLDALRLDQEAAAVAQLGARDAELAALRTAHEADVAAMRAAHEAALAAVHAVHESDVAALRTAHETDVAAVRAAHEIDVLAMRTAHENTVAATRTAHESTVAAMRSAHESNVVALRSASEAEAGALRTAHEASLAAVHAEHQTDVAALRSAHDTEITAVRVAHTSQIADARAAHDAAMAATASRHGHQLAVLHEGHQVEGAAWRVRAAADAETQAALHGAVQSAHAELSTAGAEIGRLNALLLHLQSPTGIVKLSLRAVLPAGVHRRLRDWAQRARGGPSLP